VSLPGDAARLAVGTLTVLPVAPPRRVDRRVAGVAMALAPLAALPLAVAAAGSVWLLVQLGAPSLLVAVLAVAVLALGTGGLHLDGLADTADGLVVPGDRDRRFEVMRRGDVGPVGAAVLLLVVLVQVSSLAGVVEGRGGQQAALALGAAVLVSRGVLALACARGIPAARPGGLGHTVAGSVPRTVAGGVLVAVTLVAGLADGWPGVLGVLLAVAAAGAVLARAYRRLGGITGDVLGAVVELALAGYLVAAALRVTG
jgi:adenosylcobinamide-GDP ribazoletransferase